MPKHSKKTEIIKFLCENAVNEINLSQDIEDNEYSDDEVFDDLIDDIILVSSCRRGVDRIVPKSVSWRNDILTSLDDDRFLQMLRVSRLQFGNIFDLIRGDEVFKKSHACEQFPVELQLAIVLFRLGSSGESASTKKIAAVFGIGDGGTLSKVTQRVFEAILRHQKKYISWPTNSERNHIVSATYHELPHCIGYVDATEVKIAEAPVRNKTSYFSRKHIYSIKAQVVCDYSLRIRSVVVGHCGSAHDARIFRSSTLFKEKEKFFSSNQWIAGDSAYPLSENVITPYRTNSRHLDRNKRISFNLRHSKFRVRIEHCFGLLKEKFGSLKELRMRFHNNESKKLACQWFLVCCILHNILLTPAEAEKYMLNVSSQRNESRNDECGNTNQNAEAKRQFIYRIMFE